MTCTGLFVDFAQEIWCHADTFATGRVVMLFDLRHSNLTLHGFALTISPYIWSNFLVLWMFGFLRLQL